MQSTFQEIFYAVRAIVRSYQRNMNSGICSTNAWVDQKS